MQKIVGSLVRHGLAAVGVSTASVSEDDITKLAGALLALAMVGWSIWQKTRTPKNVLPLE